jgi:hypothetical protein
VALGVRAERKRSVSAEGEEEQFMRGSREVYPAWKPDK